MRNQHKLISFVCSLGLLTLCCNENEPYTPSLDNDPSANQGGTCQTQGFVNCNGTCIDPLSTKQYCGANAFCEGFTVCGDNETCQEGQCKTASQEGASQEGSDTSCNTAGFVKCNGRCIDPLTTKQYCGANEYCEGFAVCDKDQSCQNGECVDKQEQTQSCNPPCDDDQTCENGECVNQQQTQSCNPPCGDDQTCENGECIDNQEQLQSCDPPCGDAQTCENGQCIDKQDQTQSCNPPCDNDQTCQNGECVANDEQVQSCHARGHVMCHGVCINPLTSAQYCGANELCQSYKTCKETESCQAGVCSNSDAKPVDGTCSPDEHKYNDGCESDSVENCGKHGLNCETLIDGWQTGTCLQGECRLSTCQKDMHPEDNTCVYDTIQACGKKGFVCADRVPGWQSGACTDGQCKVLQCIEGYHR